MEWTSARGLQTLPAEPATLLLHGADDSGKPMKMQGIAINAPMMGMKANTIAMIPRVMPAPKSQVVS